VREQLFGLGKVLDAVLPVAGQELPDSVNELMRQDMGELPIFLQRRKRGRSDGNGEGATETAKQRRRPPRTSGGLGEAATPSTLGERLGAEAAGSARQRWHRRGSDGNGEAEAASAKQGQNGRGSGGKGEAATEKAKQRRKRRSSDGVGEVEAEKAKQRRNRRSGDGIGEAAGIGGFGEAVAASAREDGIGEAAAASAKQRRNQ
jgi:hypothetical protein